MISLTQNELIKMFQKKSSWIYMILVVLTILICGLIYNNLKDENTNWKAEIQEDIKYLEASKANLPPEQQSEITEQIQDKKQYLKHNINPTELSSWHFMRDFVIGIGVLISFLTVIVSSSNVAAEYSSGTIKQLLVRPYKRCTILLSKYLAATLYSMLLMVIFIVSSYIIGTCMYGFSDFGQKVLEYHSNNLELTTVGSQFFIKVLYFLPGLFMISTISFMFSTLFKNQSLAVGVGMFALLFTSIAGGTIILLADKFTWTKYLIFPHLDLTLFITQDKILNDVTLPFSLSMLGLYYVLFMTITFLFFQKKDVSV